MPSQTRNKQKHPNPLPASRAWNPAIVLAVREEHRTNTVWIFVKAWHVWKSSKASLLISWCFWWKTILIFSSRATTSRTLCLNTTKSSTSKYLDKSELGVNAWHHRFKISWDMDPSLADMPNTYRAVSGINIDAVTTSCSRWVHNLKFL